MKNMPGAGGATASTYFYRIAPKDGTVIGSVAPNAILGRLLDGNVSQYDPAKFHLSRRRRARHAAVHDLRAFEDPDASRTRSSSAR